MKSDVDEILVTRDGVVWFSQFRKIKLALSEEALKKFQISSESVSKASS